MGNRILGLDLGSNSIGWALINRVSENNKGAFKRIHLYLLESKSQPLPEPYTLFTKLMIHQAIVKSWTPLLIKINSVDVDFYSTFCVSANLELAHPAFDKVTSIFKYILKK